MDGAQIIQICLLFVGLHLLALPPLVWAMRNRQLTVSDTRASHALLDDEPDYSAPGRLRPASPARARLLVGVVAVFFLPLAWLTVRTVAEALHPPPIPAATPAPPVGKCPF